MDMNLISLACLVGGFVVGIFVFYFYKQTIDNKKKNTAEKEAERIVNKAKSHSAKIERDARNKSKDFEKRARRNVESDIKKEKNKLNQAEQSFKDKEAQLERNFKRKNDDLDRKGQELVKREETMKVADKRMSEMEVDLKRQCSELAGKLESIANMSEEQARRELKSALEDEARKEISSELTQIEDEVRKEAELKAKRILSVAISRVASEVSTEQTVTIVALTSDEMKGKIIGREGRNIRAMEAACGVDLIIDETPESVVISSFDPVRREVCKGALEKLMADGRVHPAKIEEAVEKSKAELFKLIREDGEQACMDAGVHGVHLNIQKLIGSLKYRSTGMQNLYKHSQDVSFIAGMIASEVGFDTKMAKRAGLLHAIGSAIDHTVEGSYSKVGADFARKNGEHETVCKAIACHNSKEADAESVLDHILQASHRLALARPGARRSMMESYIRRLTDLESIGNSFDGVYRTVAVQAGKEIRVMVDSGLITDDQAKMLSRDVSKKIERELNYPGQIKVAVVRETRIVEHAR